MRYKNFRDFKIIRNCNKSFVDHKRYRPYLKADFQGRCAYCNLREDQITTPFEIEHFIPRKTFEDVKPELETDYENLVFACKKCNNAKGSQFEGDIHAAMPENTQFYDPVRIDYDQIFYRTEIGAIGSDDVKGRKMIADLKLYRPIHNLAWICEEADRVLHKISLKMEEESNPARQELLKQAKEKIGDYYRCCYRIFISHYNNKNFSVQSFEEPSVIIEMEQLT